MSRGYFPLYFKLFISLLSGEHVIETSLIDILWLTSVQTSGRNERCILPWCILDWYCRVRVVGDYGWYDSCLVVGLNVVIISMVSTWHCTHPPIIFGPVRHIFGGNISTEYQSPIFEGHISGHISLVATAWLNATYCTQYGVWGIGPLQDQDMEGLKSFISHQAL